MIEYIHSSAMNSTMLTPMHGTECKGLGKILGLVVGVVAAIAVPFLAPAIGGMLGGGFFASIAGQALIGGGIGALGGAAGAALGGSDILKGALLGGAGGAIAGGAAAFGAGQGFLTESAASAAARGASAAGNAASGFQITQAGGAGTSTGLITGVDAATGLPLATAGVAGAAGAALSPALAGAPAAATATPGILGGLSTGFKTAAVQTLINGGTQLLQSMAPDQQADLFKQMQAEMEVTRTQDAAMYAAQKKIFDEYYNFAKGINPEFFGQMERANAQQRLSTTWAETERDMRQAGMNPAAIAAERRRQAVDGTAGLNTSSAGGFMKGLNAQGAAYQVASNLYPKSSPSNLQNLDYLRRAAGETSADRASGIAGLVSPWQIYAQNSIEGMPNTKKQDRLTV